MQLQTEGATAVSKTHIMHVGDDTATAGSTNTLKTDTHTPKKNPPAK